MSCSLTLVGPDTDQLTELVKTIKFWHQEYVRQMSGAVLFAHNAGRDLIQAKQLVPHGQWTVWITEHCDFSPRTAQVYMRVARYYNDLNADPWDFGAPVLTLEQTLDLLAEPKETRPAESKPQTPAVLPAAEPEAPFELQPDLVEPTGPAAPTDLIADQKLSMVAATIRDYDRQTAIVKRAELLDLRAAIDEALEKAGDE